MENLNLVIAKNLTTIRKKHRLTQLELAEKLNYSDKSISKWENAEAVPSVEVLLQMANLFGVNLDYFVTEDAPVPEVVELEKKPQRNKLIVTLLSVSLVWLVAIVAFTALEVLAGVGVWMLFIWAVPASLILTTIFACLWAKQRWLKYTSISALVWTLIAAVYLQFYVVDVWLVFIIAVPLQIAIILWAFRDKKHTQQ